MQNRRETVAEAARVAKSIKTSVLIGIFRSCYGKNSIFL